MNNWSFTKGATIEECPRKFQYEYILKLVDLVKSDAFAIGGGIHKFLEEKALNDKLNIKDCEAIYLDAALNDRAMVNPKKIHEKLHLVSDYFRHNKFITPLEINGKKLVEYYGKLKCGGNVVVSAKIDIVSYKKAVIDYKTAASRYKEKDVNQATSGKGLQITTYEALIHQDFGIEPSLGGFQIILKDGSEVQNIGVKHTVAHFEEVKKKYLGYQSTYDFFEEKFGLTDIWPANKLTAKCFWCSYRGRCDRDEISCRTKKRVARSN